MCEGGLICERKAVVVWVCWFAIVLLLVRCNVNLYSKANVGKGDFNYLKIWSLQFCVVIQH